MSAGRTEDRWKRSIQINETKRTIYAEDDRRVAAREMLQSSGLSAVLLGETDSLSVMPVAALVLVCMGIYIVNRPEKTE